MRFTKNLTSIFLRTLFKDTITQICEGLFQPHVFISKTLAAEGDGFDREVCNA